MPKANIQERILQADILASRYLGNANEASERGNQERAEKLYQKSQYWLNRYNLLTGNGDKAPPRK